MNMPSLLLLCVFFCCSWCKLKPELYFYNLIFFTSFCFKYYYNRCISFQLVSIFFLFISISSRFITLILFFFVLNIILNLPFCIIIINSIIIYCYWDWVYVYFILYFFVSWRRRLPLTLAHTSCVSIAGCIVVFFLLFCCFCVLCTLYF